MKEGVSAETGGLLLRRNAALCPQDDWLPRLARDLANVVVLGQRETLHEDLPEGSGGELLEPPVVVGNERGPQRGQ